MNGILFSSCIVAGVLVFASVINAQSTKGTPGVDYPNYHSIPATSFKCSEQKYIPGFYADLETKCQVFHFCFKNNVESFLCPIGTIFNQEKLACDSWSTSNCSLAPLFYNINDGPAMKNAGKKLPMLLKLRNRSHDKTKVTTSVYETLSSLYEGISDNVLSSENVETSNFSLNASEESNMNDTNKPIEEETPAIKAELENESEQLLSDDSRFEESFQSDASDEDAFNENLIYDPVTDGYYVDYDPYQAEWHQDPENVEFSNFYENMGGDYGVAIRGYNDYWSDDQEAIEEPSDSLDLNSVGETDESEFSKRRLAEKQFMPYRRRPTYVVLEDGDSEFSNILDASFLESESDLRSSEYATVETNEGISGFPLGIDNSEADVTTEEEDNQEFIELRDLQFPYHPEYSTEIPLTSEAISELAYTEDYEFGENKGKILGREMVQSNEQMDGESVPDEVNIQNDQPEYDLDEERNYDSDSLDLGMQDGFNEDKEYDIYLNAERDHYETVMEESEAASVDDTYVVIPDESDADSSSLTDVDLDGTEYQNPLNEYTYEGMEQMDAPDMEERAAHAYYRMYQNRPVYAKPVGFPGQEHKRPFSESVYYEPMFDAEGQEQSAPPVSREEYLDYLRRNYQGDQPMDMADSVYGEGNGYVSGDYYDPYTGQISDYYEYNEDLQYYPQMDDSCNRRDSVEDAELANEFGITDEPFISDMAESDFQATEEAILTTEGSDLVDADLSEFSYEDDEQPEETYYVLDLDEDEQVDSKSSMKDSSNETFSRSDVEGSLKTSFESGEPSLATGNILFKETSASSSGQIKDFQSEFGSSQNIGNKFSDFNSNPQIDSWSSFVTQSSADDKPITISSALERLASVHNTKAAQPPSFSNLDFSANTGFMNNVAFPESMDFGAYGYGTNMGQFGMVDSMQAGKPTDSFSHRKGENKQQTVSKLSSIQERLRSMKQGKFGVFKKYMNTMKDV